MKGRINIAISTESKQVIFSDEILLKSVLKPYKRNCHYLINAFVKYHPSDFLKQKENEYKSFLLAKGKFSILQSCYIRRTGHFNAVEFNICYNQLAYYLLAECVQHKLIDHLKTWDIEAYTRRQLSDILIANFTSSFQKPIFSTQFEGYVEIRKILKKDKLLFINTVCGFNDDLGGSATGNVLFVIDASHT